MELRLDTALQKWISQNPTVRRDQYVIVFEEDAKVVGPFASDSEADLEAFKLRPKSVAHICQVGAHQYSIEHIRPSAFLDHER